MELVPAPGLRCGLPCGLVEYNQLNRGSFRPPSATGRGWQMMTDLLMWAPINLGRWFGTQVRVHILLILFVVTALLSAAIAQEPRVVQTACWLVLLLAALAIHEFAHAVTASWLGVETDEVRLWPLGNMVVPPLAPRSGENFLVVAAGPLANAALAVS